MTRCPQCLSDALVTDAIALLHLRCQTCGCIVIPSTGGPLFGCETCARRGCPFKRAGVGVAHCKHWRSRRVIVSVRERDLFGDEEND